MNKDDQRILAVRRDFLFGEGCYFEGFQSHDVYDFETRICSDLREVRRGDVEDDRSWKQPITYTHIVNPSRREAFVYRRKEDHTELRLRNLWSLGVGGHIEPLDLDSDLGQNPLRSNMRRELREEASFDRPFVFKGLYGYINDDSERVGEVHFGLLYVVETLGHVSPKSEFFVGEMRDIDEIEELCEREKFEGWSRMSVSVMKDYLGRVAS